VYEKILSIEEVTSHDVDASYYKYDGYLVKTEAQEIFIGVDNMQCCCESFGAISSEDDLGDFVGGYLRSIKITDKGLNTKVLEQVQYLDEGGAVFLDLETTRGTLQLVVYNAHNGYYGHTAVIRSRDLNDETGI
jgi:hypothetical protein